MIRLRPGWDVCQTFTDYNNTRVPLCLYVPESPEPQRIKWGRKKKRVAPTTVVKWNKGRKMMMKNNK